MGEIFLTVFNAGAAAGWVVTAVLVIRALLRKMPAYIHCILWNIVLVRLLLPAGDVFPRTSFSLIPSDASITKGEGNVSFDFSTGIGPVDSFLNEKAVNTMYEGVTAETGFYDSVTSIGTVIWAVVAVALLAYGAYGYIRLKRSLSEAVPYRDNIYRCGAAEKSPFIAGFVRPKIYIGFHLGEEEERLILAHENAHISRRDNVVKMIWYIALCVYWFNPLIWAAYILLCRDMERACDEKVLAQSDADVRKEYAGILLSMSTGRRSSMITPAAFSEISVKERIKAIMNYRKPGRLIVSGGFVLIAVCAVLFLSNPAATASDEDVYSYNPAVTDFGTPSLTFTDNGNQCTFIRFGLDSNYITGSCYEENDVLVVTDGGSGDRYRFEIRGEGEDREYIFDAESSSPLASYDVRNADGETVELSIPDGAVFRKS